MFVSWAHGISGGDEIPNIWGRLLDEAGQPVGEPAPIGDRVLLSVQRLAGLDALDGLSFASERISTGDAARFWRFMPNRLEEVDVDLRCASANSYAVHVEGRLVTACFGRGQATLHSRPLAGGPSVEVGLEIDDSFQGAALSPRSDENEVLVAAYFNDGEARWVGFARLSATLDVLQPLTRSNAAYAVSDRRFAYPVPEGWQWWTRSGGVVRMEVLDRAGQVVRPAIDYPSLRAVPSHHQPLGGGHYLVLVQPGDFGEPLRFVRVDARGEILQQFDIDVLSDPSGDPGLAVHLDLIPHQGAYWLAWTSGAAERQSDYVYVQRIGCAQP